MALPIIGIILFSAASYHSLRRNQEIQRAPSRYLVVSNPLGFRPCEQTQLVRDALRGRQRKLRGLGPPNHLGLPQFDGTIPNAICASRIRRW